MSETGSLRSYKLTIDNRDFTSGNIFISETMLIEAESKKEAIEFFETYHPKQTMRGIRMLPLPRKPKPRLLSECRLCQRSKDNDL